MPETPQTADFVTEKSERIQIALIMYLLHQQGPHAFGMHAYQLHSQTGIPHTGICNILEALEHAGFISGTTSQINTGHEMGKYYKVVPDVTIECTVVMKRPNIPAAAPAT